MRIKSGMTACSGAFVALAQFALEQLAAGVFRQRVGEDHALGDFEAAEPLRGMPRSVSSSVSVWPGLATTTAVTASIQRGSGRPITATSDTPGNAVHRLFHFAAGDVFAGRS